MNMDLTATESRLRVLLELITQQQESRCQELLTQARHQAMAMVKDAKQEAANRVKVAAREAKRHSQQSLDNAKAHLDTARRQRHLQHLATLLAAGREQLRQALLHRWQQADYRHIWIHALSRQAASLLPAGPLTIWHPPDWDGEEWPMVKTLSPVTLMAEESIQAGLLICRGGTCLDGTLQGLAGEDAKVDAWLLALMQELQGEHS